MNETLVAVYVEYLKKANELKMYPQVADWYFTQAQLVTRLL